VLTRDCPVDCLRTVLGTAAFHFLARPWIAEITRMINGLLWPADP
jgi:hypothetical protein